MALLEVVDLRKRFGGLHAVAGVSFEVAAGEIVGLIGPNGAGKTTLFHLISGFAAPDRGEVRFEGATTRGLRPHELVGLEDRADRTARGLTLADRKRLELARALATEPRLLLLDEVMAGLTPTETERIIEICRAINARGIAILLIEHVMRAVMALSRRVVVLSQGQVLAAGTPDAIARDPRVVEAYLGEAYDGAVGSERAGA